VEGDLYYRLGAADNTHINIYLGNKQGKPLGNSIFLILFLVAHVFPHISSLFYTKKHKAHHEAHEEHEVFLFLKNHHVLRVLHGAIHFRVFSNK